MWRAGAVHDALADRHALVLVELDGAVLQVNEELPLQHEEELVLVVVLVPVELALEAADADDAVVDLGERAVPPGVVYGAEERPEVNQFAVCVCRNFGLDVVGGSWGEV